jgi:hypothetical protein
MKKVFFCLIFQVLSSLLFSEIVIVRVQTKSFQDRLELVNAGYDISGIGKDFLDVTIEKSDLHKLNSSFSTQIIRTEKDMIHALQTRDGVIPGFHTYDEVVDSLQTLEVLNPSICSLQDIGDSLGKEYALTNDEYDDLRHEIYAFKISDNVDSDEDEPQYFFLGAHHAREPSSTEAVLAIIHELVTGYNNSDPEILDIVNNKEIWFVPIVNPNSHALVVEEQQTGWRKNIRDNDQNGLINRNQDGVDLNRNYGFHWNYVPNSYPQNHPTYQGTAPFSEPETQSIRDFLRSKNFVAGISFHSAGQYVMYPYGNIIDALAPDNDAIAQLAETMADVMPSFYSTNFNYTPQQSWEMYPAQGVFSDWAYGELGIFSYCVELCTSQIPSIDEVEHVREHIFDLATVLLNRDEKSTLTGIVTNANTNHPLEAKILIQNYDDQAMYKEPYTTNSSTGRYYRFLLPGTYRIKIEAEGYETSFHTIEINDLSPTELNVPLQPKSEYSKSLTIVEQNHLPIPELELWHNNTYLGLTDSAGQITLNNLTLDEYFLHTYSIDKDYSTFSIHRNTADDSIIMLHEAQLIDNFETISRDWVLSNNWQITEDVLFTVSPALTSNFSGVTNQATLPNIEILDYENPVLALDLRVIFETFSTLEVKIIDQDSNQNITKIFSGDLDWSTIYFPLESFRGKTISLVIRERMESNDQLDTCFIDNIKIYQFQDALVENQNMINKSTILHQNFPNPFNPETSIAFTLAQDSQVNVSIFNLRGQKIKTICDDHFESGSHTFVWSGKNDLGESVSSGVYFYKLNIDGKSSKIMKCLLLK